MATHPSVLAWRIPWTEELGRLRSMGPQSRTRLNAFHSLILPEQQEKSEGPGFLCFFLSDKMTPQFGFVNSSRAVSADCGHQFLSRTLGAWFKMGFCTAWIFLHLLESPLQLKM